MFPTQSNSAFFPLLDSMELRLCSLIKYLIQLLKLYYIIYLCWQFNLIFFISIYILDICHFKSRLTYCPLVYLTITSLLFASIRINLGLLYKMLLNFHNMWPNIQNKIWIMPVDHLISKHMAVVSSDGAELNNSIEWSIKLSSQNKTWSCLLSNAGQWE